MLGKHKFHVGQRVQLSTRGIMNGCLPAPRVREIGTVVGVKSRDGRVAVLWDYRKSRTAFAPELIEPAEPEPQSAIDWLRSALEWPSRQRREGWSDVDVIVAMQADIRNAIAAMAARRKGEPG